jgi:1,2-dihydroxy-3-keto-5-methylthiopentene dioxygenase
MSRLTIYEDAKPKQPALVTEDAHAMAQELARIGVRFERWESPVALSPMPTRSRCWRPTSPISTR